MFSNILKNDCSFFIKESRGVPVYKTVTIQSPPFVTNLYKIKARHKNTINQPKLNELYSVAFEPKIREKCIFTHGNHKLCDNPTSTCYIFPKNGYKYLYSAEVSHSSEEYKEVLNTLIESFPPDKAYTIITDMLKFTYNNTNLVEGLKNESEVLFYNIPYFYAVPTTAFPNYEILFDKLRIDQ